MLKKKQLAIIASITAICFLIGTTFTVTTLANGASRNPFNRIWGAIYDLQARVTSLEESIDDKTWHFVTSFTLSTEEQVSPLFFIQGEKWRIKWEPQQIDAWGGWYIWDENGYVDTNNYNILYKEIHNIHYLVHAEGSYYIEWRFGPNIDFTIESYH